MLTCLHEDIHSMILPIQWTRWGVPVTWSAEDDCYAHLNGMAIIASFYEYAYMPPAQLSRLRQRMHMTHLRFVKRHETECWQACQEIWA